MANTSDDEGRTLQIVNDLRVVAEILEPSIRWEIKPDALAKSIDQRLLKFVQERLAYLLTMVFVVRTSDQMVAQCTFIAYAAEIIYEFYCRRYGTETLAKNSFAKRYGIPALCVALAIYAKTIGVERGLLREEEVCGEWKVYRSAHP